MITKTATHQTTGAYKPTAVDAQKAACDFVVIDIAGVIDWKDGRRQFCTKRELKALKAAHSWMTNF
jgi:hypothetical protein